MASLSPTQERADGPSPELRLVRAIIAQAVQDAFASTGSDSTHDTDAENRKAAIAFLTAPDGAHARHRNDLCELAGFDGTRLRKRVIAVLEGEDLANLFDDTRRNKDFLARARAIWAAQKMDSAAQEAAHADWLARRKADAEKRRAEAEAAERNAAAERVKATADEERRLAQAIEQDAKIKQSAAILRHLREGPKTLRQLYFDMGGTMDREAIRWRLNKAREAGLAELNGTEWSLVPLPQSPDQHLTSNLSEAIPTT